MIWDYRTECLIFKSARDGTETDRQAWGATAKLAARHRLTLYGAAYLELARRRCLPLATLDSELRVAATAGDVALLGLRE